MFPRFVDTGGDTPHTVHNASVKLSRPFNRLVIKFPDALNVDLDEIGQRESLQEIAAILDIKVNS